MRSLSCGGTGPVRRGSLARLALVLLLATAVVGIAHAGDEVEEAGTVLTFALPAVSAGASLLGADGDGLVQLTESAALALGVTYGLKYAVNAERPNGGDHSFPSGHATLSFCSAEFLRRRHGWAWGLPAYAAAGFIGYSRVEASEHYAADVVAGAIIGVVSAWMFTRPHEHLDIDVTASSAECGLTLAWVW